MALAFRSVCRITISTLVVFSVSACTGKGFTQKSESMMPTLLPGDHFFEEQISLEKLKRGMVIIITTASGDQRVYRLIGKPGDRVAMKNGVPIINGEPALQASLGPSDVTDLMGGGKARLIRERLPGELEDHRILDDGWFPQADEMDEILVTNGHYFVMGDCRDRSADSRISPTINGLGMITASQLAGIVRVDSSIN